MCPTLCGGSKLTYQALAHPVRIAILEQLREGELSAGAIIERLAADMGRLRL